MPEILSESRAGTATATACDSGSSVRWFQAALNQVLRAGLTVDGGPGPQTRAAIRAFQQRRGLVVDGQLTSLLERALVAAGATPRSLAAVPTSAAGPRLIRREDTAVGLSMYVEIPLGSESPAR